MTDKRCTDADASAGVYASATFSHVHRWTQTHPYA